MLFTARRLRITILLLGNLDAGGLSCMPESMAHSPLDQGPAESVFSQPEPFGGGMSLAIPDGLIGLPLAATDTAAERLAFATEGNGIAWHHGTIMNTPIPVCLVFYGNWGSDTAPTILAGMVQALQGSNYWAIN